MRKKCGLLALLALSACLVPDTASAGGRVSYNSSAREAAGFNSETQVLTIGISAEGGSEVYGGKATQSGYVLDYLKRLAYYARIQDGRKLSFQFVSVPTTEELERMAADGEIDLYELTYNEKDAVNGLEGYSGKFLQNSFFVDSPVGQSQYALCTLSGNRDLFFEETSGLEGSVIGHTKEQELQLLNAYAASRGFDYTPKIYPDEAHMEDALESGELDAAVINTGAASIRRVIGYLGKTKIYLGACEERGRALVDYINGLQTMLYNYEPFYDSTLAEIHYADYEELYEAYTRKEQEYIASLAPLRVAVCENDEPSAYLDKRDGTYKGTYIELLKLIGQHSHLQFEYVPAATRDECLLKVREGEADLVLGVYALNYLEKKWNLFFSEPLMTKYIAAVGKRGNQVKSGYAYTAGLTMDQAEEWLAYIREYYPQWDERFYTSERKSFEAVENGTVDIALVDGNSIQASKLYSRYRNVGMISSLSRQMEIVLGLSDDKPAILKNIINKSVRSLSSSEVISCQMDNALGYNQDLEELFREYLPYLVLGLLSLFLLAGAVLAVSGHRKRYAQQKEAFFSNMSHEIRTPLNGIVGMTSIAQKNMGDVKRVKECLDKIEYSCSHLMTIVNDILDLSRLEKNKMQIAREEMNLRELLHSVHVIYAMQAAESEIDYDTVVNDVTDEIVIGDYTRLSQVLMNLLGNAMKFTPSGKKVRLEVAQKTSGRESAEFAFRIRDEGIGIPKENLQKIFNAYEQQGAKTAGKYGGSGLGLPISLKLVELMGGRLRVASAPGEGSTFYFTLTFSKTPRDVTRREDAADLGGGCPFAGWRGLLLTDQEECKSSLSGLLKSLGMTVAKEEEQEVPASHSGPVVCFVDCDEAENVRKAKELKERYPRIRFLKFSRLAGREAVPALCPDSQVAEKPLMRSDILELLSGRGQEPRVEKEEAPAPDLRGRHVLIAEDNEINMEIICELVGASGCGMDKAENGREAVERFEQSPPGYYSLILMDIQMPVMNGYEASRAIRALNREDGRRVFIAAMTADAFQEDIRKAKEAGMNRHLSKPIRPEELYGVMAESQRGGE